MVIPVRAGVAVMSTIVSLILLLSFKTPAPPEVAGYTHQPAFGPARKGDVVRIVLNPALAHEKLAWQAAMPLHDGLASTYKFFSDGAR